MCAGFWPDLMVSVLSITESGQDSEHQRDVTTLRVIVQYVSCERFLVVCSESWIDNTVVFLQQSGDTVYNACFVYWQLEVNCFFLSVFSRLVVSLPEWKKDNSSYWQHSVWLLDAKLPQSCFHLRWKTRAICSSPSVARMVADFSSSEPFWLFSAPFKVQNMKFSISWHLKCKSQIRHVRTSPQFRSRKVLPVLLSASFPHFAVGSSSYSALGSAWISCSCEQLFSVLQNFPPQPKITLYFGESVCGEHDQPFLYGEGWEG